MTDTYELVDFPDEQKKKINELIIDSHMLISNMEWCDVMVEEQMTESLQKINNSENINEWKRSVFRLVFISSFAHDLGSEGGHPEYFLNRVMFDSDLKRIDDAFILEVVDEGYFSIDPYAVLLSILNNSGVYFDIVEEFEKYVDSEYSAYFKRIGGD